MAGVITGFAIILSVIGVGFLLAKLGVINDDKQRLVLNRIAFYAATPALLFNVVARSDPSALISPVIVVTFVATIVTAAVYCVISAIFFKKDIATTATGAAASAYVNSNNIGLPVSIYVLGTGAYVAPILVMQMVIFAPMILAALTSGDVKGSRGQKIWAAVKGSLLSPIVLASIAGLIVCLLEIQLPAAVMEPTIILGGASIPLILMSFGASLPSTNVLASKADRPSVLTATAIKIVGMPAITWLIAKAFGLEGDYLYAAVILAALPAAQNVYNYAATYRKGEIVARDTVFLTTFLALLGMLGIAALFGR
ncbi:putative secondary malonate transporter, auxin efflux carrier (AEC) family [Corynebacterium glutamicum MB001]|uniref:Predicted permeases n=1 Tax=Corynebacterium glutamicum (strain ATCC 13032 / DSM 20300 / JCM 1318 / BCRC 11384 / CCUG 27702 / LMG 3730 / NBRC 12168 / NCIMB 10025 / NRRL B-2784 / 534) TaxID=196627 RepID=Q8NN27_CORGL|nr:AEC family transporter [Corynebacterium glutamicum]AGT06114.1 putative secondary malonate transporter, auxin efflux carrier (AEC) family [Corynebacterium glutamicum MB001]AIK85811.1 permease [Corynebacterium glutamicum]AIK88596.1 permease [Corynebacterium glutamicum]AMA00834.1 permease [Corynebacterium glutamicum]ARV63591.1 permease [Corynebacterium glutamicum]